MSKLIERQMLMQPVHKIDTVHFFSEQELSFICAMQMR